MNFLVPDLEKYYEATDIAGHVFNPDDFKEETLEWIARRNDGAGCRIPCFDSGDFRLIPGTMSVWAGINGHGKSALLQQFCLWWSAGIATDKKEKILFWSPEMDFKVQVERMIKQVLGIGFPTVEAASYAMDYLNNKIAVYGKEEGVSGNEVIALTRWAADHGFTQIVIDSLMMVDLKSDQNNLYLTQKNFVRTLKESARITGIHVHLVAHMRKSENETRIGDKMDIKGSGEITDLADYAFIVFKNVEKHRELQNAAQGYKLKGGKTVEFWEEKPDGFFRCIKNRYDSHCPGHHLWWSGPSFSFKNQRYAETPKLTEPTKEELNG